MCATELRPQASPLPLRSMFPSTDQALLQRMVEGDDTAFWMIWEHYRVPVFFPLCMQWACGNVPQAEELLSEATLKARIMMLRDAHKITNTRNWLTRLVKNHCIDWHRVHIRNTKSRQTRQLSIYKRQHNASMYVESAEDLIQRREMIRQIHIVINTLPPRLRQPSYLYFLHQMTQQDIADQLQLTPATVRKRIQMARAIMQLRLSLYLSGNEN